MYSPTGLIPWFSKTEGNTYATLLHHPFLFKGKPTHAQEVATVCSLQKSCELGAELVDLEKKQIQLNLDLELAKENLKKARDEATIMGGSNHVDR